VPDHNPADTLTAAAKLLRSAINSIPPNSWDERPWHVETCMGGRKDDCPCIVAQGTHGRGTPPVEYVADAETPEYARYIALMHPGVGLALADWLETAATYYTPGVHHPTHVTRAYQLARVLLGEVTE